MRALQRLKGLDFFKKLPSDLTEATLTGAGISVAATVIMVMLFVAELTAFLALKTETVMIVDRSRQGELLRINFNISFPALSCEFLTLDVSDSLGTKKINLTKTVRKTPIDASGNKMGAAMRDEKLPEPKYDTHEKNVTSMTLPVSADIFQQSLDSFPIVVVNFFAPWCPWCQRLAPSWDQLTMWTAEKYPIDSDGRIAIVKVDCTQELELCKKQQITGFPSVRIYRKGTDDIVVYGQHEHEAYHGDRSLEALQGFIDSLIPSAGNPHARSASTRRLSITDGCNVNGFVLVKKVPGTMHFHTKTEGYSFDHTSINMTHEVHGFTYGGRPTPRRLANLGRLHPGGLAQDWADKLSDKSFTSVVDSTSHEHYLQVVLTTIEPLGGGVNTIYDAYEYTVHSHTFTSDSIPAAKFSYALSPIQIVVKEKARPWYHFLTTTCAIIGGVFTVLSLLDGVIYQTAKLAQKMELGKQG